MRSIRPNASSASRFAAPRVRVPGLRPMATRHARGTGRGTALVVLEGDAGRRSLASRDSDRPPRPRLQTYEGGGLRFGVSKSLAKRLRACERAEKVTRFSLLLAAYQILLHRHSGQPRILVGSPAAARSMPEFEGIIGYITTPLVFDGDFSDNPTVREALQRTQKRVLGGLEHQDFPFPLLVERLKPERDPRRSPVFQAMFSFEASRRADTHGPEALLFGGEAARQIIAGLDLELLILDAKGSQFDLTLAIHEASGALHASFEYNSDLFERPPSSGWRRTTTPCWKRLPRIRPSGCRRFPCSRRMNGGSCCGSSAAFGFHRCAREA